MSDEQIIEMMIAAISQMLDGDFDEVVVLGQRLAIEREPLPRESTLAPLIFD